MAIGGPATGKAEAESFSAPRCLSVRRLPSTAHCLLPFAPRSSIRPPLKNAMRLPETSLFGTVKAMEVHFSPEQEAQLAQIAGKEGTVAQRLVKDAALCLLEEDVQFRAAVREGVAHADRGEFIEEDEMDARLEQMLGS